MARRAAPPKLEALQALGPFDAIVDTSASDAPTELDTLTGAHGMDIVVDNIGEPATWDSPSLPWLR